MARSAAAVASSTTFFDAAAAASMSFAAASFFAASGATASIVSISTTSPFEPGRAAGEQPATAAQAMRPQPTTRATRTLFERLDGGRCMAAAPRKIARRGACVGTGDAVGRPGGLTS